MPLELGQRLASTPYNLNNVVVAPSLAVLGFFCQLPLSKSQADALLRQLAQHWDGEFDILCDLLAHAAVVYMDETGWKVNCGIRPWNAKRAARTRPQQERIGEA